jgi:hypothetical protein
MNTRRLWFHGLFVFCGDAPARLTAMLARDDDAVKKSRPSGTSPPRAAVRSQDTARVPIKKGGACEHPSRALSPLDAGQPDRVRLEGKGAVGGVEDRDVPAGGEHAIVFVHVAVTAREGQVLGARVLFELVGRLACRRPRRSSDSRALPGGFSQRSMLFTSTRIAAP